MKILAKIPVSVSKDNNYTINSEGLSIRSHQAPIIEGNLFTLPIEYLGEAKEVSLIREDINSILNKLEKYQSGKMSDKEVSKMINKIKNDPLLSGICSKMASQTVLDSDDLELLNNSQQSVSFEFDYSKMFSLLDDNFQVDLMILENLVPSASYQSELSDLFESTKLAKQQEQKAAVARIMGIKPKQKTVVDYLIEKKQQIKENKPVIFNSDSLISLPQANDLERVLDWGQSIYDSVQEQLDLEVLENDHHQRDIGYYSHALKFLGLVFTDDKSLCLTYAGESFFTHDRTAQKVIVLDILTKDPLIEAIFNSPDSLDNYTAEFNARGLSGETIKRRISCLLSWKNYLLC